MRADFFLSIDVTITSGVKLWTLDSSLVTIRNRKIIVILMVTHEMFQSDNMIKSNRRTTIDGVAEELGIVHKRAQKMQSPESFLDNFLKLIKWYANVPIYLVLM
ncbi:hypothetical protein TNCV_4831451 [Trichonephila clavipes]|nr:hypothetical protein TNCV_4831451 [Trichonephila clavipes]